MKARYPEYIRGVRRLLQRVERKIEKEEKTEPEEKGAVVTEASIKTTMAPGVEHILMTNVGGGCPLQSSQVADTGRRGSLTSHGEENNSCNNQQPTASSLSAARAPNWSSTAIPWVLSATTTSFDATAFPKFINPCQMKSVKVWSDNYIHKFEKVWIKILSFKREAGNIPRNYLEK